MPSTEAQLTLDLFNVTRHAFDEFHAGPNSEIVTALRRWSDGAGPPVIYLWGVDGCGKSHLLQAAVQALGSGGGRAMYLPLADLREAGAEVLDGLDAIDALAIDDVDAVAGVAAWEQRLFNLYNALGARAGRLLWCGRQAPAAGPFALRDLSSRLAASLTYQVHELGEAAKGEVLTALAARRGLALPASVLEFILRRERRDLGTLIGLLERLDQAALAQGRALTIPFVREVLAQRA